MSAADWFIRELALFILVGELGNALIGMTQLAWSYRSALKILMFWVSLGSVVDWVFCSCVVHLDPDSVLLFGGGRRLSLTSR